MALTKEEIADAKALEAKKIKAKEEEQAQKEGEEDDGTVDTTVTFVQMASDISVVASGKENAKADAKIDLKSKSKANSKSKKGGSGENAWDNVIGFQAMTDTVVEKANGDEGRKFDDAQIKAEKNRKEAEKQAEEEKKAVDEARNELLAPDPVDMAAIQTEVK